jgi:hypothetical protein
MSDLFDRFVGTAEVITSHTADSGDSWGPSGTTNSINGAGSAYSPAPTAGGTDLLALSSWTPPSTDYAASVVFGLGFRLLVGGSGDGIGLFLRATASDLHNWDGYGVYFTPGTPDTLLIVHFTLVSGTFTLAAEVGTTQNLATQVAAGDTLTCTIAGTSPPAFTVHHNATPIYAVADTSGTAITAPGSAGLFFAQTNAGDAGNTDIIRTFWAGTYPGPSESISPSSATVALSGTQTFTAVGLLPTSSPTETVAWTAGAGSVTAGNYTAPGSGSSDTVTWTSYDLPLHTATATVTLTTPTPTPTPTATPRGKKGHTRRPRARLDAPLPTRGRGQN